MVSCKEVELSTVINGKKEEIKGYELILDDTILFPEGGGQVSVSQKKIEMKNN